MKTTSYSDMLIQYGKCNNNFRPKVYTWQIAGVTDFTYSCEMQDVGFN